MPDLKRKYLNSEKLWNLLCKAHCEYYLELALIILLQITLNINALLTYETDLRHISEN